MKPLEEYLELEKVVTAIDNDLTDAEKHEILDRMDVLWMKLTYEERTKLQSERFTEAE